MRPPSEVGSGMVAGSPGCSTSAALQPAKGLVQSCAGEERVQLPTAPGALSVEAAA